MHLIQNHEKTLIVSGLDPVFHQISKKLSSTFPKLFIKLVSCLLNISEWLRCGEFKMSLIHLLIVKKLRRHFIVVVFCLLHCWTSPPGCWRLKVRSQTSESRPFTGGNSSRGALGGSRVQNISKQTKCLVAHTHDALYSWGLYKRTISWLDLPSTMYQG